MRSPSLLTTLAAAVALPGVVAHGTITQPAAVWKAGYPQNGYASTIDNLIWGTQDGSVYGYGTNGTLKYFETNFPKSGYTTLRDLILAKQTVLTEYGGSAACGYTIKDEAKRATLPSTLQYSGFTHPGPCEVWCDQTKLAYALDCQTTYPNSPASIPIDTSKCKGADQLTVYWLAVHGAPWQVYNDCVWLTGSTAGSAASGSVGEDNETTTAPTTTPTSASSADSAESSSSDDAGSAQTPTTPASTSSAASDESSTSAGTTPTPTPSTPVATTVTTSKPSCVKRRRV